MRRICTLSISDAGSIMYSGRTPPLPAFYQNLFLLLVNGIHRTGGAEAEEIWKQLPDLACSSVDSVPDDNRPSTSSLLSMLYNAIETRKRILELLSGLRVISTSQINGTIAEDDVKITETLQWLLESNAYKKDIPTLPQEHAVAVMNLTHYILDRGLPDNDMRIINLGDSKLFFRRAHRLLNWLAAHLKLVPEGIAIKGVVLLTDHPVKHGGFSNIYHGRYTNADGAQVEVALKVLKIFDDQSDERRQVLHDSFNKEALVWHYLKHENIVPFLGIDSTTFPSPARAMVSPWMPLGSVLKYMIENSPSSHYAIQLLGDVIQGLKYLHSSNIVHGDLCGRNILMDSHGRAQLADFGLVDFIESETSRKSSTRSGSTRWMAPELLIPPPGVSFKRTPASDVWAFGCVACEIWSEGEQPFSHIGPDTAIIFAFSHSDTERPHHARPYESRPSDKGGEPMPDWLWDLVQSCSKIQPSERPSVSLIADIIPDTNQHARPQDAVQGDLSILIAGVSETMKGHDPALAPAVSFAKVAEYIPPSPTPPSTKGKQRLLFEDNFPTVRFGPVDMAGDPEEVFSTIFDGLLEVVRRDVLADPVLVEELSRNYLGLRFRSLVEAHNFAMTWSVYRFEPFLDVSASLVDEN
ncbi:kinase-like domain-containing protein [Mycena rebaudengoi]|nr:kinase-like domain-containing protein [Mycena rebaudengoi]